MKHKTEIDCKRISEISQRGSNRVLYISLAVLTIIVTVRLFFLSIPVLVDPSDARYAHVAEHMILNGEWLSPMIHNGNQLESYWSKPPLGFWAMATSMSFFGVSEFSARLPALLATILTGVLIYFFNIKLGAKNWGIQSVIMYFTTPFVFVMAGSTLVDPILSFLITGTITALGLVILDKVSHTSLWISFAYVCMGLGILTKGPIAVLLPTISILMFLALARDMKILKKICPLTGIIIVSCLVAPWFFFMEKAHPGFLRYFIIEENLNRLVSSNLKLRSGSGHKTFTGFALFALPILSFPWIILLFFKESSESFLESIKKRFSLIEYKYVISWMIAPLVFLTFGKQVLAYYLLPIIPGVISFVAIWLRDCRPNPCRRFEILSTYIYRGALLASICIFLGVILYEQFDHIKTLPEVMILSFALLLVVIITGFLGRFGVDGFSRASIALIMAVLSLCTAATEPLAEYKSSAALFQFIALNTDISSQKRVSFLYEAPPSSYFYSQKILGSERSIRTISIDGFREEIEEGLLISRDRNFDKLPQVVKELPTKKIGKWVIQDINKLVLEQVQKTKVGT